MRTSAAICGTELASDLSKTGATVDTAHDILSVQAAISPSGGSGACSKRLEGIGSPVFTDDRERSLRAIDRYRGALLGLAVGDALGAAVEFRPRGSFPPVSNMVGGGPFGLAPGQWTDDTSMALCLAESLIERNVFDPMDQMQKYLRWWREGYNSSTGQCFDVGQTTAASLARFEQDGHPFAGGAGDDSAGNGSLMRLAPVALRYAHNPAEAVERAGDSSRTTHGAREAVDACRYFAALLVGALAGVPKIDLLARDFTPRDVDWTCEPLAPAIRTVAAGSFKEKAADDIMSSGYVVHTLEAALWAFHNSDSFHEGALRAINLGDDSDTVGAVYGQLAGAYYGENGIPADWRARITRHDDIRRLARDLFEGAFPWRGSRKHVLDLMNGGAIRGTLNTLLRDYAVLIDDDHPIRPSGYTEPNEFDLREFRRLCIFDGCDLSSLDTWWAPEEFRGPTWDLLAQCTVNGQPGILLVEAKARVDELDWKGKTPGSGSAQSKKNEEAIRKAIGSAEDWFRRSVSPDCRVSADHHYQLANRLATAQALATCGLQTVLLFLGFTGDQYFADCLRNDAHWTATITEYTAGVLPADALGRKFHDQSGGSITIVVASMPVRERSVLIG